MSAESVLATALHVAALRDARRDGEAVEGVVFDRSVVAAQDGLAALAAAGWLVVRETSNYRCETVTCPGCLATSSADEGTP